MKAHRFVFVLIAVVTALVALANLDALLRSGASNLPFLGVHALPMRLIGPTALAMVGALLGDGRAARLDARDAEYLRRIAAHHWTRRKPTASIALRAQMDTHSTAITAKLETRRRVERTEMEGAPVRRSA